MTTIPKYNNIRFWYVYKKVETFVHVRYYIQLILPDILLLLNTFQSMSPAAEFLCTYTACCTSVSLYNLMFICVRVHRAIHICACTTCCSSMFVYISLFICVLVHLAIYLRPSFCPFSWQLPGWPWWRSAATEGLTGTTCWCHKGLWMTRRVENSNALTSSSARGISRAPCWMTGHHTNLQRYSFVKHFFDCILNKRHSTPSSFTHNNHFDGLWC